MGPDSSADTGALSKAKADARVADEADSTFSVIVNQAMAKVLHLENSLGLNDGKKNPGSKPAKTLFGLGGCFCTSIGKEGAQSLRKDELKQAKVGKVSQSRMDSFFQKLGLKQPSHHNPNLRVKKASTNQKKELKHHKKKPKHWLQQITSPQLVTQTHW
jgi:hypothetical protein